MLKMIAVVIIYMHLYMIANKIIVMCINTYITIYICIMSYKHKQDDLGAGKELSNVEEEG